MAIKISKSKFERYVGVQRSGVCNMFDKMVQDLASLTQEEHLDIIKNYDEYAKRWPEVAEGAA